MDKLKDKPPLKYTEMAIYIDNHIYTDDCDEEKVFIYLYHLALMLARKSRLFQREEYYEDFAIMFAEDIFIRLKNPKQYELKEDGSPKMQKLKSVLNYMKNCMYGRKVAFEQSMYSQSFSYNQALDGEVILPDRSILNRMNQSYIEYNEVEIKSCLEGVCKMIRSYLKNSPYASNRKQWESIYISCLLTLLNSFVLTAKDQSKLLEIQRDAFHGVDYKLQSIYSIYDSNNDNVVLYHCDESLRDYILVLYKRLCNYISETFKMSSYDDVYDRDSTLRTIIAEMNNLAEPLEVVRD